MPYAWNCKWNRWYGIRTPNQFSLPCCKSNQSLIKIHNFNTSTLKRYKVGRTANTRLVEAVDTGQCYHVDFGSSDDSRNSMDVSCTCTNRTLRDHLFPRQTHRIRTVNPTQRVTVICGQCYYPSMRTENKGLLALFSVRQERRIYYNFKWAITGTGSLSTISYF